MKTVVVVVILVAAFIPTVAQDASSPSDLWCGPTYTWRARSCNYPNDKPPCFAQIQESHCLTTLNKYHSCDDLPGILCCGHTDPVTGQPYLQADYTFCNNSTLTAPPGMAEAARKYARKLYIPSCQGGYIPSVEKPAPEKPGAAL